MIRPASQRALGVVTSVVLSCFGLSGCDLGEESTSRGSAHDAGTQADGGLFGCPDPNDPWVHYVNADPSRCIPPEQLPCTADQYGFHNACGCGCIDKGDGGMCPTVVDPAVRFISRNPAECAGLPVCELGETPFSNSCGCGCIQH